MNKQQSRLSLENLADRHMRPTRSVHQFIRRSGPYAVRISIQQEVAQTPEGQRCLGMAALLLAKQFGLVHALILDVPSVPVFPGTQCLGSSCELVSRIQEIVHLASAGHTRTCSPSDSGGMRTIEVVVGAGGESHPDADLSIGIMGADWGAYLGPVDQIPVVASGTQNPVGPFFAACLGAGEAFRFLSGLQDRYENWKSSPLIFSLWDLQKHTTWDSTPPGEWHIDDPLKPAYLVGVGAVGQAFVACIVASDLRGTHLTVIDGDTIDSTNLNRYCLSRPDDLGHPKVQVVASLLKEAGHTATSFEGYWDSFLSRAPLSEQPEELASLERSFKFELMLSCVDKNVSRQSLQQVYPRALLGGSTLDFRVQVAVYSPTGNLECLKCHHPAEMPSLAPEALAQKLAEMTPAEHAEIAERGGVPLSELQAFLQEPPKCGMVLPESLSQLAGGPRTEMAVGFVSVAAGILLFRDAWMVCHNHSIRSEGYNGFSFGFAPLKGFEIARAKSPRCDCRPHGLKKFQDRWGAA